MPLISINPKLKPIELKNNLVSTKINHEFISMIDSAYRFHRTPTITPDDIWLVILQYLAKNVNDNETHYREVFNIESKKEIKIYREVFDEKDSGDVENLFQEFISKIEVETFSTSILNVPFLLQLH